MSQRLAALEVSEAELRFLLLRNQAVEKVRTRIWEMRQSHDMEQVLQAVKEGLRTLGVPFQACGVNEVKTSTDPPNVLTHSMIPGGYRVDANNPGRETILRIWREQRVAYRRDLLAEDPYGERRWIDRFFPVRSIIDIPFRQGTLAANSREPEAFSPRHIDILQSMAQVLSEGFGRLEDLQVLEQRNLDLEREVAERRRAEAALLVARNDLERQVVGRTAQLRETNAELQREVAERCRAEQALKDSLKEKELLLQEIHHRVKNNLQNIASLLDLQAASIGAADVSEAFQKCRSRIVAMALVHEKLYQSPDLGHIDCADYLHTLTLELFDAYGISVDSIALNVRAEGVALGVDAAVRCGLIANELVANALKHAFPDHRGSISVVLCPLEGEKLLLEVCDDGVGLPPDRAFPNPGSLGWKLVASLVRQLKGDIKIVSERGTSLKIVFPRPN